MSALRLRVPGVDSALLGSMILAEGREMRVVLHEPATFSTGAAREKRGCIGEGDLVVDGPEIGLSSSTSLKNCILEASRS